VGPRVPVDRSGSFAPRGVRFRPVDRGYCFGAAFSGDVGGSESGISNVRATHPCRRRALGRSHWVSAAGLALGGARRFAARSVDGERGGLGHVREDESGVISQTPCLVQSLEGKPARDPLASYVHQWHNVHRQHGGESDSRFALPKFHSSGGYVFSGQGTSGRTYRFAVSTDLHGSLLRNIRARGTWSAQALIRDASGNQVDSCSTGLIRWRAHGSFTPGS
jgi:hypothetical protein